jgi:polyribonucleotide nucleotidyltransferase
MFNIVKKSIEWGGETLTLETGKIPGGFFKREARPTEKETLTSRLIDRPIRPLFVPGFKHETQVICTVLSHDLENDPDVVAMVAASAALTISGAPFRGPIGAVRVGYSDGEYRLNPTVDDTKDPDNRLNLMMAGTKDAVMMVESEAYELSEAEMLGAVNFGHDAMQPVIDLIIDLAEDAAKEPFDFQPADTSALYARVKELGEGAMRAAFAITDKQERTTAISAARATISEGLTEDEAENESAVKGCFKDLESEVVRGDILNTGRRIDGRDLTTVRPIVCETGLLPRTHGSALFTRGETQGLLVTTLGTGDDEQMIDALEGTYRSNFMLHYNFPPYSVGEAGRFMGPGRREIGHGKLAWRALQAVLPAATDFPYTIRIVSEITESNGSSSMATVCGASLSMMDAGVPLKAPVAGVAMGLILEGEKFAVLTDILGDEDHLGDMDFKVAGTDAGITSLQMDIKVAGITPQIMDQALAQAKDARKHILGEMAKALTEAQDFSIHAPRIETMQINPDKIREVIGTGGKVIRGIVEESGAKVDINDEGIIKIASPDGKAIEKARDLINSIVAEPEVGKIYTGKVVKIMDFGAFVNFFGKRDGLVHISQMTFERGANPKDLVKEGQEVKVKLMGFDDRGKTRLSMKVVDQETGKEIKQEDA